MISILCAVLRPVCVLVTVAMMGLLISYFWGFVDLSAGTVWRLLVSYAVLITGSFIVFFVDDPASFRRGRGR